jgi:hypothetical protein
MAALPVIGLAGLCGCAQLPESHASRSVNAAPSSLRQHFASTDTVAMTAHAREIEVCWDYRLEEVDVRDAAEEAAGKPGIVIDYYLPMGTPVLAPGCARPVVLLLPMAGGDYTLERYFARYFARRGFAVAIATRRELHQPKELEAIVPWVEQSIRDNLRALDWIATRPELDTNRIVLLGISLGGLRGVMLTALDGRIKAAALGLVGGDLPYILAHTREHGIVRRRDDYMRAHDLTLEQFEQRFRCIFHWDPDALAEYMDRHKVLLVLALWDRVVPFKKGWELRARLGDPETLVLPTGHYSTVLAVPYIEDACARFFRQRLGLETQQEPNWRP